MSHTCKPLIIHCIDFRFIHALHAFMHDEGLTGTCDVISLAGSLKNLISSAKKEERDIFLSQIDISKKLHRISNVYLVQHMDCGAYGGHAAFTSLKEEKRIQKTHLALAKKFLEARYKNISVIKILAHILKNGSISLEKIL